VIQASLLAAAHVQPVTLVTFVVPFPPLAEILLLDGEIEYVQPFA